MSAPTTVLAAPHDANNAAVTPDPLAPPGGFDGTDERSNEAWCFFTRTPFSPVPFFVTLDQLNLSKRFSSRRGLQPSWPQPSGVGSPRSIATHYATHRPPLGRGAFVRRTRLSEGGPWNRERRHRTRASCARPASTTTIRFDPTRPDRRERLELIRIPLAAAANEWYARPKMRSKCTLAKGALSSDAHGMFSSALYLHLDGRGLDNAGRTGAVKGPVGTRRRFLKRSLRAEEWDRRTGSPLELRRSWALLAVQECARRGRGGRSTILQVQVGNECASSSRNKCASSSPTDASERRTGSTRASSILGFTVQECVRRGRGGRSITLSPSSPSRNRCAFSSRTDARERRTGSTRTSSILGLTVQECARWTRRSLRRLVAIKSKSQPMCFLKSNECKRTTDRIHSYFVDLGLDRPGMRALDEADAPSPCCHQVQVGIRTRSSVISWVVSCDPNATTAREMRGGTWGRTDTWGTCPGSWN
jgi:hypothetical protein